MGESEDIMRKRVLFLAYGGAGWIGGLYYTKNIITTLMQSERFRDEWQPVVITEPQNAYLFKEFGNSIILEQYIPKSAISKRLHHAKVIFKYRIKEVYPIAADCRFWTLPAFIRSWFLKHEICWIPDFQDLYLPEFFSDVEKAKRDCAYQTVADNKVRVVLSSYSAQHDFIEHYGADINRTAVLPFISAIENEVSQLQETYCDQVMKKYDLLGKKYIYIPNQFWQHKNHMTVLEMIRLAKEQNKLSDYVYVFTGNLKDERNSKHIDKLVSYIEINNLSSDIMILGFIKRLEQLAIMKMASLIIQPSLFEGWGTVVEDCKVLGKKVVLSDIPIHREQMDANCVLFSKLNPNDMLEKVILASRMDLDKSCSGVEEAYKRAREYAKEFIVLIGG